MVPEVRRSDGNEEQVVLTVIGGEEVVLTRVWLFSAGDDGGHEDFMAMVVVVRTWCL